MSQPVQQGTVQGLNTYTFSAPNTDNYTIAGTLTLPVAQFLGTGVTSGVIVTVKHNASTIYTSNPADKGFIVGTAATAGDTFSVGLSSSVAQDAVLNAVQCTISISEGEAL